MASDVRRNLQSQETPIGTPTPRIDDAMLSLNEALDDLGRLRIRTHSREVEFDLPPLLSPHPREGSLGLGVLASGSSFWS